MAAILHVMQGNRRGWRDLADPLLEGLAAGLREHVPAAVGVALHLVLACSAAAFLDVVLRVELTPVLVGAVFGVTGAALGRATATCSSRR